MNANTAWLSTLQAVVGLGEPVAPRGQMTKEILHQTTTLDMLRPVVTSKARKMNYQFMAGEAHWILSGDNSVEGIAPYNKHIGQFSDDGKIFAGAYGPRIIAQLDYVVGKLLQDTETRQAVMTIWTPNPGPSKDIPCTVAFAFQIRHRRLQVSAFMRSSDVWLGLPYDVFNFSMLAYMVCSLYNFRLHNQADLHIIPGVLNLTAASSHLYQQHWDMAMECMTEGPGDDQKEPIPTLYCNQGVLLDYLEKLRKTRAGDPMRWWES